MSCGSGLGILGVVAAVDEVDGAGEEASIEEDLDLPQNGSVGVVVSSGSSIDGSQFQDKLLVSADGCGW